MIDLHSHVLPGLDDGAATPHVRADHPSVTPDLMERLVDEVGEIDLDEARMRDDAELCHHGLGGNERLLLLEFPYTGWPLDLQDGRLGRRPAACAHALLDAELAGWLTRDVPQALLAGAPIPPRPDRRRSIRLPWRR